MADCTCTYGQHDPRNPRCDQAILDGTATPEYAEAPIAEHRIVHVDATDPDAYLGRCTGCDVLVQGRDAADALALHLLDVRGVS